MNYFYQGRRVEVCTDTFYLLDSKGEKTSCGSRGKITVASIPLRGRGVELSVAKKRGG